MEGLPAVTLKDLELPQFELKSDHLDKYIEIDLNTDQFPQGSIILLKTKLDNISLDLDFNSLSFLLYRIDSEERDLLGSIRLPRYNSRDSVWWYLQSLQDYCRI